MQRKSCLKAWNKWIFCKAGIVKEHSLQWASKRQYLLDRTRASLLHVIIRCFDYTSFQVNIKSHVFQIQVTSK